MQISKENNSVPEDIAQEEIPGYSKLISINRGMIQLPLRYVLLGLLIITLLLVALSVVVTILIIRSF